MVQTTASLDMTTAHPKIQTESKEDVQFIKNELRNAVQTLLSNQATAIEAISDARSSILKELQTNESVSVPSDTIRKADADAITAEVQKRLDKV